MVSALEKIVTGGQTGVDRAALDAAMALALPHGGWYPKGRFAENGCISKKYQLVETDSAAYDVRTEANVIDSDATVILSVVPSLEGGSRLTAELAENHQKPLLKLHAIMGEEVAAESLAAFIDEYQVRVLNVAGPRASHEPDVYDFVFGVFMRLLS